MARITTKQELREYILYQLGYPVIQVEIDASENGQLDKIIETTIQDFQELNTPDGNFLYYTSFLVSAGVSEYRLSGHDIEAIFDIDLGLGLYGINVLFSPEHILLYDQWVKKGNYPGGPGSRGSSNTNLVLTDYQLSMQYLKQIDVMFGKGYTGQWFKGPEIIKINPTPKRCGIGMLAVYKRTAAEYLYNHRLVKKLCVARAKIQWGIHLTKYGVTLPDGITINGQDLMTQGRDDENKWYEEIRKESAPSEFFCG